MRLLILGLLMEKDRHPYEIRQTIKARNWHHTFRIRDGSLYYAVDQLREDGLIAVVETVSVPGDKRPDKTIYGITENGKSSFLELLYAQLEQEVYPQHPMFIALPFARHADNAQLEQIIAKQLAVCQVRIQKIEGVLTLKGEWLPRGAVRMLEGILRLSETEREWLQELLMDARSGRLTDGGNTNVPD
ncbi:PadR family transcriptional regulator [Cohnella sp.]|uniref:PadR family transcriptional regulator n=1 Tax=Cohnella sp. TaxID=1883426 RepID=UPI00356B3BCA